MLPYTNLEVWCAETSILRHLKHPGTVVSVRQSSDNDNDNNRGQMAGNHSTVAHGVDY